MKIKCIIIDDEPLARKGLTEYISDVDFIELLADFDSPLKANTLLASGEVQLLFLDIQMPKITGIDFFKTLRNAPPVIFTTAYPQYALESYDLNALDYLVKPVSFDRFLKSALKAKEFYELREQNSIGRRGSEDYFFIKVDNKLMKIELSDITHIEALQNYVVVHTPTKKHITYLTFRTIQDYLPSDRFIKVHKSYIVSATKIDSIEGSDIRIGEKHIPISRSLKDEVMEKILKGKFLRR